MNVVSQFFAEVRNTRCQQGSLDLAVTIDVGYLQNYVVLVI